jgi:methionine-S-sulfoxide reductase
MPKWATLVVIPGILAIAQCAQGTLDVSNPQKAWVQAYSNGPDPRLLDAEALQVVFDPEKVTYRQLLEFFYKMHDPTTLNRQGPDAGTQYRSAIFFHDEEQEGVAKDVTERVQKEWWKNGKITTQIVPAGDWYDAETYHQLYLNKNPGGYECPSQYVFSFKRKRNMTLTWL